MKIKCLSENILNAISKAEKIVGKNLNNPVLNCILLEAKNNNLIIRSTNLDLGIEILIPAKVENEGIIAIPGNIFKNLLSNISNQEDISLEIKDNNLFISTKNNTTTLKAHSNDDFPSIPKIKGDKTFVIDSKKLIKGFKSVWYSASISNIKPELSSVLINIDENYIYFVATDSFRLAEIKIPNKSNELIENILIPFKNIPEIIRVFEDVDGDIDIDINKNQIAFKYNNIYLTSRVVEGVFPDYKQLIPKEFTTEVVILLEDFIKVFKITNIFSDKFNQVNFNINPKNKKFEITSKSDEVGENINIVPAALSGEELNINFNCKYITDCFQSISTDSIMLQFNSTNKPMIIRGVSDNQFLYLLMSMNK
ncbi:MAG: DNA polymerase III subunit beta [Candidatus Pacebacteria bacterium]|nr:DNA polymerase III subunit beta [Candidatus Paceibacterota bacterium]